MFDIENDNALVSEKTVIDTIEAEDLDTGDDSPAASFINKPGKFVLLLYHNDTGGSLPASSVTVDNGLTTPVSPCSVPAKGTNCR